MKFDKNYDLPEGTVEADLNVSQKLNQAWVGLRRVTVVRFENGKEESIGGLTCTNPKDDQGPEDDPEEIIDALYRIGFMKSSELGRSIQCRVKYFVQNRENPHSAVFTVTSPEITLGREKQDDETAQSLAGQEGAYGAIALATLRSQQTHINATQAILNMQQMLLLDANNRVDNAHNRESALAQMLLEAHMRDLTREDKVYTTLDNALQATIDNARMFGEIHRREMTIDLELERARLKADGTNAFIKEIGSQLSAAAPLLLMAGMAKMTGADPAAMAPMMAMMGGGMPGPPVKTGAAPPPPPSAPRSAPVARGRAPASSAVPGPPMPTPAPNPVLVPSPAPAAAPPTINPGGGIGAMSSAVGATITAMQWAKFSNILQPEHVQRLRDWLTPSTQTDAEAIGAMLRCVQVREIAHALGPAEIITNEQGLQLEGVLTQLYASMGVSRPASSQPVQVGPEDLPALNVMDSEVVQRSVPIVTRDVKSNTEDSKSSSDDSKSPERSGNGASSDSQSSDSHSDDDDADSESDSEEDPEPETNGASKSNKNPQASKSKKKATKKASKSRTGGARRPSI
jgi:hypothetical protein